MVLVPTTLGNWAHMNFMEENLGIHRVASVRVDILRRMAKNAHLHAGGITSVGRQLVMTGIAACRANDVVNVR